MHSKNPRVFEYQRLIAEAVQKELAGSLNRATLEQFLLLQLVCGINQSRERGVDRALIRRYAKDYITLYGISDASSLGYPTRLVRDGIRIEVPDTATATELIVKNPSLFCDYEITKGKMDDIFLAVTGKHLEDSDGKEGDVR
jgi:hypothetical protein